MTRAEWDALSARERDAVVGRALGFTPAIEHIATCDGGVSAAATTSRTGPWFYENDLRDWLDRQHAKWLMTGYTMATWERWPAFTESWDAMREVVEKMGDTWFHLGRFAKAGPQWRAQFGMDTADAYADTAPEAVAIAALTALGHMEAA